MKFEDYHARVSADCNDGEHINCEIELKTPDTSNVELVEDTLVCIFCDKNLKIKS